MAQASANVIGLCDAARQTDHLPQECASCVSRHLAVCAGLNPDQLNHLASYVTRRRIDAGQALFQEGDGADHVFTVTSGVIKQYKLLADGRCQVTGFYFAGDLIGLPDGPNIRSRPRPSHRLPSAPFRAAGFPNWWRPIRRWPKR